MIKNRELELYVHIPFCVRKCAYCDFLSAPADDVTIENYVSALIAEIRAHGINGRKKVSTIFIGGGTPSVLSPEQIRRIFDAIFENFEVSNDAEITIEANPGTLTEKKLQTYLDCKINRISFGLQSTSNEELKLLGRIHSFEEFVKNYNLARKCGFQNINVDLISAIPGQTVESWKKTLCDVLELQPEHLSAYSLIIEEGTPFAKLYGENCEKESMLPDEEAERQMYHITDSILQKAGYHRYEISNYAKEGCECRHNLGYWERVPYLGIGLGAASLTEKNVRYHNETDLEKYIKHSSNLNLIQKNVEALTLAEQMEEFIFLGLRKVRGISIVEFEELFGTSLDETCRAGIEKMIAEGFLTEGKGLLRLTDAGIDVSNQVFAEILS